MQTGEIGRAERRCFLHLGPVDRRTQNVGKPLHRPVRRDHAAINPKNRLRALCPRPISPHRSQQIMRLETHRLERRTGKFPWSRIARQSEHRAARVRIPIGRAEADKGGHEVNLLRRVGLSRHRPRLRRVLDLLVVSKRLRDASA